MDRKEPERGETPEQGPRSTLLAVVVGHGSKRTCTIYPPGTVIPERGSRWMTARGDDFVALDACR